MDRKENEVRETPEVEEKKDRDIYKTEEITIEEMAIDGICGVY